MESLTESPLPQPQDSSAPHVSLRADTTAEEDRKTAGQRNINEKWETTQQWTAIITNVSTMGACLIMIICGIAYDKPELALPAFLFMCNMDTQVTTSYFTRTNHTKTGGVGGGESKDSR
jgi:hypothetical protein